MDLLCLGDNIVDRYLDDDVACPGGNCVNVAVHAARAGVDVAYAGSVGHDSEGAWILDALGIEGVTTSPVMVRQGNTGFADIHRRNGERQFGDFDRGVSRLTADPDWFDALPPAAIVHSSYSSGLEDVLPGLEHLGALSFDFDSHLDDAYRAVMIPHVKHAFFSGSEQTREKATMLVHELLDRGVVSVTVTRGGEGAIHGTRQGIVEVEARHIDVVDTLGAGDAFIGTVLAGILQGQDPSGYLTHAVRVAADVCRTLGGFGHSRPRRFDPTPGLSLN
ncbi:PfkB family carbohydrate kinase [Mariniluteicoccus flavus]